MNLVEFLAGMVILTVVTADFLLSTIGAQESTLLSLRVTRGLFRWLRRVVPTEAPSWSHSVSGPLVMMGLGTVWFLGVAMGWTMIFHAWPGSIRGVQGHTETTWWDTFAHVSHLISTLGASLTIPSDTTWYVVGAAVAVMGVVLLSLAVSFILSTSQTVAAGRAFAALGDAFDPADAATFEVLAPPLTQLCASLASAPYALFYSHLNPGLRLPAALVRLAENAARGDRFDAYRGILQILPGLDTADAVSNQDFLATMRHWSAGYSLSD